MNDLNPETPNAVGLGYGFQHDVDDHPMAHCVMTCEIAKCPGMSYGDAQIIEGLWEEFQWARAGGENEWWDDAADYNLIGDRLGSFGKRCKPMSCIDLCRQARGNGLLPDP